MEFGSVNWQGKSLSNVVNKLVLGSLVYFLWQEINFRIFQAKHRTSHQVIKCIIEAVRMKMLGLKIRNSSGVFNTLRMWIIKWDPPLRKKHLYGLGLLNDL